jgi:hypothetical protein
MAMPWSTWRSNGNYINETMQRNDGNEVTTKEKTCESREKQRMRETSTKEGSDRNQQAERGESSG